MESKSVELAQYSMPATPSAHSIFIKLVGGRGGEGWGKGVGGLGGGDAYMERRVWSWGQVLQHAWNPT